MSNLVFVRLRPLKSGETQACLDESLPAGTKLICKTSIDAKAEEFEFDRVLSPSCSQQDVFEGVKHIVQDVLEEGYNGTVMAYGQTSAGKTHTMFGSGSGDLRGIVARVAGLALTIAARPGDCTFKISASVVEIYNEKCRDLLDPGQDNLQILQDAQQGVHVPGMTAIQVHSEADCLKIVQKGMSARAVGATDMNEASSRSHCLVILTVNKTWKDGRQQRSKLCLVDLAGSERQSKTGASGVTLQEGQNINKSLLVLGSVVNALNDSINSTNNAKTRVPYRDSKLTRLLQDSLGGKTAKTCIVICCSPAMNNSTETLSSLRFGARARAIQSKVQANAISQGPQASLVAAQAEIAALKNEAAVVEKATAKNVAQREFALKMTWGIATAAQAVGILAFFAADSFFRKYCEV